MMFGRFTERSQKVLAFAQEEAVRLGHNNIGTEHILLGLVKEGEGIAAKALQSLNISLDKVQTEVETLIGKGQEKPLSISYTPRAKKVIELSMDEARKLGHTYVGTEHILLGLIREGEGVAARVLNNLGISLNKARQQVLQLLGNSEVVSPNQSNQLNHNTPTLDGLARDLTSIAKAEMQNIVEKMIEYDENRWVNFFNNSRPITSKLHSLELLPGIGKKTMWEIIQWREKISFKSFSEIHEKIGIEPIKVITKRILEELEGGEKYDLFVDVYQKETVF